MRQFVAATLAAALTLGSIGAALADGDPERGAQVFKKCRACHMIGEGARNLVGPELNGVVGRKAGSTDYSYSEANKKSGLTWDVPTLKVYLANPQAKVPGTKMTFPGLSSERDIDDVIAYLAQFGPDGKKK